MTFILHDLSVVILADPWNPAMFNQHWLINNKIFVENEELLAAISAPQVSNFRTKQFNILVLPTQLQFEINPELSEYPYNKLVEILQRVDYAPIRAIGVNFKWKQDTEGEAIPKFTRSNYCYSDSSIFRKFTDDNAKFGLYLSKDFLTSRLKLNILPIREKSGDEYVQYSFNYHHDLNKETDYQKAIDIVKNWKAYFDHTRQIIDSY